MPELYQEKTAGTGMSVLFPPSFFVSYGLTDTPYGYMMYTHKGYVFEKDSQEVDSWIE